MTSAIAVILRVPSLSRAHWTTMLMADASMLPDDAVRQFWLAIITMVSRREKASRGGVGVDGGHGAVVAGVHGLQHVQRFGAAHSPTMMRSGRMRRALMTRSRWVMAPAPSIFDRAGFQPHHVRCCSCSSAVSSMVTTRSSSGMKRESVFSMVVLPEPEPPEMTMFSRASTQPLRKSSMPVREGLVLDQIFGGEQLLAEAADGHHGADQRQRRDDGADARAVGQARVDDGRGVVDAAADVGDDAVDDHAQVRLILEADVGLDQLARRARRRRCRSR